MVLGKRELLLFSFVYKFVTVGEAEEIVDDNVLLLFFFC